MLLRQRKYLPCGTLARAPQHPKPTVTCEPPPTLLNRIPFSIRPPFIIAHLPPSPPPSPPHALYPPLAGLRWPPVLDAPPCDSVTALARLIARTLPLRHITSSATPVSPAVPTRFLTSPRSRRRCYPLIAYHRPTRKRLRVQHLSNHRASRSLPRNKQPSEIPLMPLSIGATSQAIT